MPTTFLHTADWQLGKPFARVPDPDNAAKLRRVRLEVIDRIGEIAKSREASFIVVAGDLFDAITPEKKIVSAAFAAIGKIGVPVFAIPGNHDHGGPGGLWEQDFVQQEMASLAPNFHILLDFDPVELDDAILLPCPLLKRHESSDPTTAFRDYESDSEKPRIILAHGSIYGFDSDPAGDEDSALGTPNLIALDRLPGSEIDFVALGDWHGTKIISSDTAYSGTPEIDRFPKGTDNDPGNILAVTVTRKNTPDIETIPTGLLGWHTMEFDFASDSDLTRFEAALTERLGSRAGEDLLHLTLCGSLGISAANRLDLILETWRSRLLRIKERNEIRLAPSDEEIETLTRRAGDPLITNVASSLMTEATGEDETAAIARIALRELYAACAR